MKMDNFYSLCKVSEAHKKASFFIPFFPHWTPHFYADDVVRRHCNHAKLLFSLLSELMQTSSFWMLVCLYAFSYVSQAHCVVSFRWGPLGILGIAADPGLFDNAKKGRVLWMKEVKSNKRALCYKIEFSEFLDFGIGFHLSFCGCPVALKRG